MSAPRWRAAATILLLSPLLPRPARAQSAPEHSAVLLAGPAPYDLVGTGTGTSIGGEYGWHFRSFLHGAVSLNIFSYRTGGGARITHLLPEFTGRIPVTYGPLRPYLGAGYGLSLVLQGPSRTVATLHAAFGLDASLTEGWFLRAEARLRSIRPWSGDESDLRLGLGKGWP